MWGILLTVNSVLWALAATYFVYSIGTAILTWSGKQFLLGLVIFVFFSIAEIVIAAISEP